jgi:hypothetical protein
MTVAARRRPMSREFARSADVVGVGASPTRYEAPRLVRRTVVDFGSLGLPADVRRALAEGFWCHFGVMAERCIHMRWHYVKVFDRFARESGAITSMADVHGGMLRRYVEWLNFQRRPDGQPWTKSSRASAYTILRKLLQWIERCRPGVMASVEYPFNPFPWRNRDGRSRSKMPAGDLRALLRACEADIARIRAGREAAAVQRVADACKPGTLGWLLEHIDRRCGGIVPTALELTRAGQHPVNMALHKFGGVRQVEPCLYPRGESLLPYYLAIMIHAAGNPDPIAELCRDCLQSLPLLDDRQALVWFKARASSMQRRTFSSTDRFEPPALVKEILSWNEQLRPLAPAAVRDRLFLYKGQRGVTALTSGAVKQMVKDFCERHSLPRVSLASIRPGVLASFYRASGDLRRVKAVANHAHLSTSVRYVQTPEVEAQHRTRIAALQQAFIGHIEQAGPGSTSGRHTSKPKRSGEHVPAGELVSMFGFGCKDPLAGASPGTRRGELCTNFMGCFTCPNAIITPDPSTLARLLQASNHLRAAAAMLHPARWQAFYAPQLRILEEDILPRFAGHELAAAHSLVAQLPPLPDLR